MIGLWLSIVLLVTPLQDDPPAQVNWITITDLDNLSQSPQWANSDKKVFIDLYTQWCGWCKRMDGTTFTDPTIIAYLNANFHCIRLDAETKETLVIGQQVYSWQARGKRGMNELGEKLGTVQGKISYPTLVFLNKNLRRIQAIPGYRDADDLLPILVYFAEDHYRKTPWDTFLQSFSAEDYP